MTRMRLTAMYDWLQIWLLDLCLLTIFALICVAIMLQPATTRTDYVIYRTSNSQVLSDQTDEFYIYDAPQYSK